MPTLLTNDEIFNITGAWKNHFDTFSHNRTRTITVHKEPLKILNGGATNPIYGYDEPSVNQNYNYTPVYQSFPAVIMYEAKQEIRELEEIKIPVNKGVVKIKVETPCRDYIEDGRKNERFELDGKSYNNISHQGVQNVLGLVFYIYQLENTL